MYHSRIYSAKVISSTLMYLLFKSIPLMIIIIIIIIGYKVIVVPIIIGCLGGGIELTLKEVK